MPVPRSRTRLNFAKQNLGEEGMEMDERRTEAGIVKKV